MTLKWCQSHENDSTIKLEVSVLEKRIVFSLHVCFLHSDSSPKKNLENGRRGQPLQAYVQSGLNVMPYGISIGCRKPDGFL